MEWENRLKVIVGLGNPESRFDMTRHNIGFRLVDACAEYMKFKSGLLRTNDGLAPLQIKYNIIGASPVILVKPRDWMNNSGFTVWRLSKTLRINPKQIMVIHDDMDFDFGVVRIKSSGGSGRHNGVESVIKYCGKGFVRFRFGIGRPYEKIARDYVLSDFSYKEQRAFCELYALTVDVVNCFVLHGAERTMSKFNSMEK